MTASTPASPPNTAATSTAASRRIRIIHLEDSPLDASLVEEMLKGENIDCEITLVSNKEDFVRELAKGGTDVIISDYNLPSYCGVDALQHTREAGRDTPFIFVSGSIGEERAAEVVKLGATDYVMKEHLRRLGIAVRRAVEGAQSARLTREAEARLRQEREFLADIFSSVQDGIAVLDTDLKIVRTNPTVETLFANQMPLAGKPCSVFGTAENPVPPSALGADTLRDGKPTQNVCTMQTAKGMAEFSIYAYPLLERRTGEQTGVILYLRNITREQALQQQLIRSQKMECVGQLAGGVAHDFNNILQAIMGFSDMLATELPEQDPRHADAVEIRKMADRAASLTRQLLAFSRKQVLSYTELDLNALITNMGKMLQRLMGENIKIQYAFDTSAPHVRGDTGQIEQVVLNLVVNARDAMPDGGQITISTHTRAITAEEASARTAPWRAGTFACISVKDTGTGIPPKVMAHIFEPFFTTKEAGKGTGLGLSTVYGIVQQHEGWVNLTSEMGRGTTFIIYIPILSTTAPATDAGVQAPATAPAKVTRGHILILEDDVMVRQIARRCMENSGHAVQAVGTVTDARAYFAAHSNEISLLISDVVLGDGNGLEMAVEFNRQNPRLKVLMMSGYLDGSSRWEEIQKRKFAFLGKPFSTKTLAEKVAELLT